MSHDAARPELISVFFFFGLMSLAHASLGATTEAVEIRITGISSCQGSLMLAVYDDERHFMKSEQAIAKERLDLATAGCVPTWTYRAVMPYGRYAVTAYHDVNGNGVHDKDFFGAPTEAWGVSNNARPVLRAPTFTECAFTHAAAHTSLAITIR